MTMPHGFCSGLNGIPHYSVANRSKNCHCEVDISQWHYDKWHDQVVGTAMLPTFWGNDQGVGINVLVAVVSVIRSWPWRGIKITGWYIPVICPCDVDDMIRPSPGCIQFAVIAMGGCRTTAERKIAHGQISLRGLYDTKGDNFTLG